MLDSALENLENCESVKLPDPFPPQGMWFSSTSLPPDTWTRPCRWLWNFLSARFVCRTLCRTRQVWSMWWNPLALRGIRWRSSSEAMCFLLRKRGMVLHVISICWNVLDIYLPIFFFGQINSKDFISAGLAVCSTNSSGSDADVWGDDREVYARCAWGGHALPSVNPSRSCVTRFQGKFVFKFGWS